MQSWYIAGGTYKVFCYNLSMEPKPEQLLLAEMQVLLAEKRTYYALLRTGMAVITVPLSIMLFLLATAKYGGIFNHWWLATIVFAGLISTSLSGVWILNQSRRKLRKIDRMIHVIEHENKRLNEIIV